MLNEVDIKRISSPAQLVILEYHFRSSKHEDKWIKLKWIRDAYTRLGIGEEDRSRLLKAYKKGIRGTKSLRGE